MTNYLPRAAPLLALLTVGCATVPQGQHAAPELPSTRPGTTMSPVGTESATRQEEAKQTTPTSPKENTSQTSPAPAAGASPEQGPPTSPHEELAVLRVQAGALITQVNGDPKLHCTRPDCSIPLPPGTHRFTVGYKDTATRAGSTVTYASMYPRVVEVTLEPGHHYSVTAAGRYSQRWWIAIEDQTAKKTVYDDRQKPE